MRRVKLIKKIKKSNVPVGALGNVTETQLDRKFPYKIEWDNGDINHYNKLSEKFFEIIEDEDMAKRKNRKRKNRKKKDKGRETVNKCAQHNTGYGYVHQPTGCYNATNIKKADDDWETDLEVIDTCGRFKADENGKVFVWVEPLAKVKIDALMEEYKSREWLGYLLGDKEKMLVKDIFIPEQNATSVRVDEIQCEEFNDLPIIGVIHSHHNMGVGFSGTDHAYINQNHDISILVAHAGMSGQVRSKVPCGAYIVSEIKVRLALNVDWAKEDWIKEVKEKIKKPVYSYGSQVGRVVHPGGQQRPQFDGTGYWFNGQWHPSYPREAMTETETPQRHITTWLCTECDKKNYNMSATICAHCHGKRFASIAEENQYRLEKEWENWEDKNKKKEDDDKKKDNEWSSGISKKNLGSYMCGRCHKSWNDVDLSKFTKCPECDKEPPKFAKRNGERHRCDKCRIVWIYNEGEKIYCQECNPEEEIIKTESFKCKGCNVIWEIPVGDKMECPKCDADIDNLIDDLKKDLDNAELEDNNIYKCPACEHQHWTLQDARDCCSDNKEDKDNEEDGWTHPDYKCDICGKVTQFAGTTHAKCLKEMLEKDTDSK